MAIFKISEISNEIAKAKLIKHKLFKSPEQLTKYLNSNYCTDTKIKHTVNKYILEEICNFAMYPNRKYSYYEQLLHIIKNESIQRNWENRTYIIAGKFICLIDTNDLYITPVFRINHFTEDSKDIKVTDINNFEKNISYGTLCSKFPQTQDFRESLIYFINGDQEKLFHYMHNPFHATALVAVLVSEVIRNPIMILNNRIAIQINTLHTFSEFLQILPSLAGGTWKSQKPYGPKFLKRNQEFLSNVEFSDLPLTDGD